VHGNHAWRRVPAGSTSTSPGRSQKSLPEGMLRSLRQSMALAGSYSVWRCGWQKSAAPYSRASSSDHVATRTLPARSFIQVSHALLSKCAPVSSWECTSCSITSKVLSRLLSSKPLTQLLRCSQSG